MLTTPVIYLRNAIHGIAFRCPSRSNTLIKGVTLHSYRYAWAERAKTAGYPERFAQESLGHNSKAVHRAYARLAKVELPSLGEYERQQKSLGAERNTSIMVQA